MRPLPAPMPTDLALGTALAGWWAYDVGGGRGAALASLALMTLPLGWRRTAPLATVVLVSIGFALGATADSPPEPLAGLVAVIVAPYSAAVHAGRLRSALAAGGVALGGAATEALLLGGEDLVFVLLLVGAAWAAGMAVRGPRVRSAALEGQAEALRERARAAAEGERARLARELHDVVAHSVSLMVVQAGAAEQVLREDPARAARALESVQATGRAAVDDLRRMLGLLRGDEAHELSPQPGLAAVDDLVAAHDGATLERGELPPVPAGIGLAAYRIVQESLTNARRHAAGRPTSVRLDWHAGRVRVEVRTTGVDAGLEPGEPGHGLAGMRERVALYGGDLSAGREAADWVVRATLPVTAR